MLQSPLKNPMSLIPTSYGLFTNAMATGKQAWDWRIVANLKSERVTWDGPPTETHLNHRFDVHMPSTLKQPGPAWWAQVKPLENAKQTRTEQNPEFQTQTQRTTQECLRPTPNPHVSSYHSNGYFNPDHCMCPIPLKQHLLYFRS